MLNRKEKIHFIGIGGAGMFPMAEILHKSGYRITGSDSTESEITQQLREWGIDVQIGHRANLVKDANIVVYTAAISPKNEELVVANEMGKLVVKRAVMLGDLMRKSFSIGISGTHGKTTTTSMIAKILEYADKKPTVIVGGLFKGQSRVSGAMVGDGKILVAEADEYDRSFLQMYPTVAITTNIQEDHLDIYKDLDDIKESFLSYLNRVPFYGEVILSIDDEGVRDIVDKIYKPYRTYGFSEDADIRATRLITENGLSKFSLIVDGDNLGEVIAPVVGVHNIQNLLAAITVSFDMGIDIETIKHAIIKFPGVKRRLEFIGENNGVTVIDDYAHHPEEVEATLKAVKLMGYSKITVIFQPHLFTRTQDFYREFADVFSKYCDELILIPIYPAREEPIEGVTSQLIVDTVNGISAQLLSKEDAVKKAISECNEGEVIITMGAGDVTYLSNDILKGIAVDG